MLHESPLSLTICAMSRNTLPYIIEWILFHHLQGVQHFVIFDDDSQDDIMLLPELFESAGFGDMVEIYPMNFLRHQRPSLHDSVDQYENQMAVIQHCNVRRNSTDWMIVIDTDEFMYSQTYPSILDFLVAYNNLTDNGTSVNSFLIQSVRFGTSGLLYDFKGKLDHDTETSSLQFMYDPNGNNHTDFKFPLLIDLSSHRAPHPDLDENFQQLFDKICQGDEMACNHSWGKAIYRPRACRMGYIHYCNDLEGLHAEIPIQDLRVDHFGFRSREKSLQWDKEKDWPKIQMFEKYDRSWFSLIRDDGKDGFVEPLRKLVGLLKPVLMSDDEKKTTP